MNDRDAILAEQCLMAGVAINENVMPVRTYIVRASETRVHTFRVEATSEAEAMSKIAEGEQDFDQSLSDGYDSMEVMDATLESELRR